MLLAFFVLFGGSYKSSTAEESAGRPSTPEPFTRAVLHAALELTRNLTLRDATFAVLSDGMDKECLIDVLIAIAEYNNIVRIMAALRIDPEPEFGDVRKRLPLPASGDSLHLLSDARRRFDRYIASPNWRPMRNRRDDLWIWGMSEFMCVISSSCSNSTGGL